MNMDDWTPNPKARPYFPQRRGCVAYFLSVLNRRCTRLMLKGCLLTTLVVTVIINVAFLQNKGNNFILVSSEWKGEINSDSIVQEGYTRSPHVTGTDSLRQVTVHVISSREVVAVWINGSKVVYNDGFDVDRGIHVLVLNQATGVMMAHHVFDTYQQNEDDSMIQFLQQLTSGRIVIFAIKDEGTFQMKQSAKDYLANLGSVYAKDLAWRDMWVFITHTDGGRVTEGHNKSTDLSVWADEVTVTVNITLTSRKGSHCPVWPDGDLSRRRQSFCEKYAGYKKVCSCVESAAPVDYPVTQLKTGGILDLPVVVIASNRPQYLYRMLTRLLQTPGVPKEKVMVFIDGMHEEPLDITRLLGLRGIQHTPAGVKNARISQHYKASLTAAFGIFPEAKHVIILEEDLDVSPDFFSYFQQLMPLLDDGDVYCISAWNDQGYNHSSLDPALLYRVETMPGLGWMMTRSLFMDELLPQWPSVDKQWDWDMWMRHDMIRKERECIIPDISRTYHFGSKGLNVNPYFQDIYFKSHALQSLPYVKLKDVERMRKDQYEKLMEDLIMNAKLLNHSKNPCEEQFIPDTKNETYVLYMHMEKVDDFRTWKSIAKCYKLWDLDVRGFHKSMWRQFLKQNHLIIVGAPASVYSKYMPKDIIPVFLEEKEETKDNS